MKSWAIPLFVLVLTLPGLVLGGGEGEAAPQSAGAEQKAAVEQTPADQPKAAENAEGETPAEAEARAAYEAAEKAAREAEAALGPLRAAMQKADVDYANARKEANAKRQKATEAKNLAGEPGVQELARAEANLADAVKTLAAATEAKPPLDKALAEAKAAAAPLQQAYDAAEKAVNAIVEAAHTDRIGDGKIFVLPLEEAVRIRTGERGPEAL